MLPAPPLSIDDGVPEGSRPGLGGRDAPAGSGPRADPRCGPRPVVRGRARATVRGPARAPVPRRQLPIADMRRAGGRDGDRRWQRRSRGQEGGRDHLLGGLRPRAAARDPGRGDAEVARRAPRRRPVSASQETAGRARAPGVHSATGGGRTAPGRGGNLPVGRRGRQHPLRPPRRPSCGPTCPGAPGHVGRDRGPGRGADRVPAGAVACPGSSHRRGQGRIDRGRAPATAPDRAPATGRGAGGRRGRDLGCERGHLLDRSRGSLDVCAVRAGGCGDAGSRATAAEGRDSAPRPARSLSRSSIGSGRPRARKGSRGARASERWRS